MGRYARYNQTNIPKRKGIIYFSFFVSSATTLVHRYASRKNVNLEVL